MTRRMKRAIRTELPRALRWAREWPHGPYPPVRPGGPDQLSCEITVEPCLHKEGRWFWTVEFTVGDHRSLSCREMAPWWHPGDLTFKGRTKSATEAETAAREVIDFARSVFAELVTMKAHAHREQIQL